MFSPRSYREAVWLYACVATFGIILGLIHGIVSIFFASNAILIESLLAFLLLFALFYWYQQNKVRELSHYPISKSSNLIIHENVSSASVIIVVYLLSSPVNISGFQVSNPFSMYVSGKNLTTWNCQKL